jgi:hypothetical protein
MDWAAQLDPAYAAARADGTLSVKVKEFAHSTDFSGKW